MWYGFPVPTMAIATSGWAGTKPKANATGS